MHRHTHCLLLAALLAGCAAADGGEPVVRSDALQGAAGATAPPISQTAARCAFEYAQCLLRDPFAVVACTERAENCGLFEPSGANMSMPSPSTSPTCALKLAECIARNPFRAPQCAARPCE